MSFNKNNKVLIHQLDIYINTYKKQYFKKIMNVIDNKMFNMYILNLWNKLKNF